MTVQILHPIKPIDWCLIQYLTGLDLNEKYSNDEDTFKILLKQYILHFQVTTISSRDKKRLLEEFFQDYKNFLQQEGAIVTLLKNNLETIPNDDLVWRALQIAAFRIINKKSQDLDLFYQFIKENNQQFFNFFQKITKKIHEQ